MQDHAWMPLQVSAQNGWMVLAACSGSTTGPVVLIYQCRRCNRVRIEWEDGPDYFAEEGRVTSVEPSCIATSDSPTTST